MARGEIGKEKTLGSIAARRALQDLIIPTLSNAEQSCLQYFIRHFYDTTEDGSATIVPAFSKRQLHEGSHVSQYVFDLGVALSSATISDTLKSLTTRGLVTEESYCRSCFLSLEPGDTQTQCPRCNKRVETVYRVATITPDLVRRHLNSHYDGKHSWDYDESIGQFYAVPPLSHVETNLETPPDHESVLDQARNRLWFPSLVDKAVDQARAALKSGQISDTRILNGFYKPILELQDEFPEQAMEHALKETVRRNIAGGKNNSRWFRYARVVAQNHPSVGGPAKKKGELSADEATKLLEECMSLNIAGDRGVALTKLQVLLESIETIRMHFTPPATAISARNHILEAFKKGISDYRAVQRYSSPYDFMSDWNWGDEVPSELSSGTITKRKA